MENIISLPHVPQVPYQKMYATLFNAVTDALGMMEDRDYGAAMRCLQRAQMETEETYLDAEE